ncbi:MULTISPECIES: MFS transporter [Dyadobacter]|uniref:MFS transporter n=2 Tax=Dyadobacter TaxID=120831 RepID=A0A9X1P8H3_9BACT|nr:MULTISPECIES: MFS transporter [Dyadobacter]MCF0040331.1 MFS transporter [Dyadobacter fanqingshengii]MCF2494846.1 MFS transporter [Dyadobacter chenhuakuii]MCF2519075.1 MFS transporter [Dyadobacter sp. CY351]USJ31836.1 MFS transporter [Dyadobacter chenhuakuii]USJ37923.1 MFS transporter [Dyadobacter fanqingshengii]
MSNQQTIAGSTNAFPWLIMILMSSVTFVGILSELMPSGVMPQINSDLNISELQGGNLVGYYAIASAIFAIPLVAVTLKFNRKILILILLAGFAASNIMVGILANYTIIIILRIIGGICAGVMWPMIAAYGMRLVNHEHHGKAIAVIMAGNTLGISAGMPSITFIGNRYGWRAAFIALGIIIIAIAVTCAVALPFTPGEKLTRSSSPFSLFKIPSVLTVLLLTLLGVMAHYGVYVYITRLVDEIELLGGIESALLLFGSGSLISVLLAIKYIDKHLRLLTTAMFALVIFSMLVLLLFGRKTLVAHVAFFLWGLSFGPLVTLLQAAVSRQVESGKDVATSVQSSAFNLSIMIATSAAGVLLGSYSPMSLTYFAIVLAIPGMIISIFAKKALD